MVGHYYVYPGRLNHVQLVNLLKFGVGFHYSCRSWDRGSGVTLEHMVGANHVMDVFSDVSLLNEDDMDDMVDDFDKYVASRKDITNLDKEWNEKVMEILEKKTIDLEKK